MTRRSIAAACDGAKLAARVGVAPLGIVPPPLDITPPTVAQPTDARASQTPRPHSGGRCSRAGRHRHSEAGGARPARAGPRLAPQREQVVVEADLHRVPFRGHLAPAQPPALAPPVGP